ncbi:dihydrofolate reductase family protein [Arthrobacter pascens]|jgi:dihydrofolate reductase|uniref:dihydrofolate reductase family protein n=1 Tax=Arthrobacter pascens TaxID=1677 RepID=UPI00196AC925|nr:dihydrofolate reductase family protein [Arthrobacter pascens]MBN3496534.1 dihydrofolate reductase family protein [Arthrobacter pascens]MDR6555897.1 dihydrofolate reductase [Arthrobacter pascens]
MAKLIYSFIMSLDGYVADRDGRFDWGEPDEEVHTFVNGLQRGIGTYLFGRRLYEVMVAWEDPSAFAQEPPYIQDFAELWKAADKVVFSRTLDRPSSERTRIEREFDADAVRQLKADAGQDLAVGGPELAASAIRTGLVDEFQMFISPVAVGGGKKYLPDDVRLRLELLEERRFGNGVVFLRYANRT